MILPSSISSMKVFTSSRSSARLLRIHASNLSFPFLTSALAVNPKDSSSRTSIRLAETKVSLILG